MLLSSPKGDMYDEAMTRLNHHPGSVLTRYESCPHSDRDHCIQAPEGLFPERRPKSKPTTFDHSFVTAPGHIDENVQLSSSLLDLTKRTSHCCVIRVVATDPNDLRVEF